VNDDTTLSKEDDAYLLHFAETAFFPDHPKRIGVAVSGGSDSMAVLHLFARAAPHRGCVVHAVTVNHGLRAEAAQEVEFVAAFCAKLGVSHDGLVWQHGDISGNLQDQARRARYCLISEWARANDIGHVALGHTADDQAETVLMRLARGAGVDGLSGIRHDFDHNGVRFDRPYLSHTRADLQEYLIRNDVIWIEDPSNHDLAYQRVKARKALALLKPLGINVETLSQVSENMCSAKRALEHYTHVESGNLANQDRGDLILTLSPIPPVPEEIERRLLVAGIRWVSGAPYPPRYSALIEMDVAFCEADTFTLSGCILTIDRGNGILNQKLRITREWNAVKDIATPTNQIWDGRWQLTGPHAPGLEIRALGEAGLTDCPDWRETGLPRRSLIASPAIWRGETLVSAPIAGYGSGWQAKLGAARNDFAAFLIGR